MKEQKKNENMGEAERKEIDLAIRELRKEHIKQTGKDIKNKMSQKVVEAKKKIDEKKTELMGDGSDDEGSKLNELKAKIEKRKQELHEFRGRTTEKVTDTLDIIQQKRSKDAKVVITPIEKPIVKTPEHSDHEPVENEEASEGESGEEEEQEKRKGFNPKRSIGKKLNKMKQKAKDRIEEAKEKIEEVKQK